MSRELFIFFYEIGKRFPGGGGKSCGLLVRIVVFKDILEKGGEGGIAATLMTLVADVPEKKKFFVQLRRKKFAD